MNYLDNIQTKILQCTIQFVTQIMSQNKPVVTFSSQYTVVEVIKSNKNKKTSIVCDNKGFYHIAKKLHLNDEQSLKQINMMRIVKHPNIVSCHNVIQQKDYLYMIEQYCEEGDLAFHIRRQVRKNKNYFNEELVAKWMLQLLLAIQYLHQLKIMHRNIRPENIFLTAEGNIKLGAFRSSKTFQDNRDLAITVIGSPYYMAPQCVQKNAYNQKVDIWAYGCVLYQVCSLIMIFNTKSMVQLANKIMKGKSQELPSAFSRELNGILQKCLLRKSYERPAAKQLLRTSYFLDAMKTLILHKKNKNNIYRVPIKRYKVHNINLEKAKQRKNKPNQSREKQVCRNIQKEKPPTLPRILDYQSGKVIRKNSRQASRQSSRQKNIFDKGAIKNRSDKPCGDIAELSKNNCSVQVQRLLQKRRSQDKKDRENSRQRLSRQKIASSKSKELPPQQSPNPKCKLNIPKSHKIKTQKSMQKRNRSQKKQRLETENQYSSPPQTVKVNHTKLLMPPPILPRPPNKKPQQKNQNNIDFSDTVNKNVLSQQLAIFNKSRQSKQSPSRKQQVRQDVKQVKDGLAKIFEDLNIDQAEEEQFSFDLQQDENLARLTMKGYNQEQKLLKTYQKKLNQLIEEINYKYCPNMQPIQQRTQEFDSNTFASVNLPKSQAQR